MHGDVRIETERIPCGAVTLECTVAGSPHAPLALLLHGFPESRHSWRHQIARLARRHRVIAPDLRGYGNSDRPHGIRAYRVDELAADVRRLVAAYGRSAATVVGHDWGGAIAWTLAIDDARLARGETGVAGGTAGRPLIERLVVMNCPHPARFARAIRHSAAQQSRSAYFGFFLLPIVPEYLLALGDFAVLEHLIQWSLGDRDIATVFGKDFQRRFSATLGDPRALNAALNYYRAAILHADELQARYVDGAPPIACPTMVVWGEDDPALGSELIDGLAPLFAHGAPRIERLAGCGHWVQQEAPDRVSALLEDFL